MRGAESAAALELFIKGKVLRENRRSRQETSQDGKRQSGIAGCMKGTRHESIQILRGIAALLIVAHHAICMTNSASGGIVGLFLPSIPALPSFGAVGVDLFFVISGFVMAHSIGEAGRTRVVSTFLLQRAIRILPMFWLLSGVYILARWSAGISYAPAAYLNTLTILPIFDGGIYHSPPLFVGWTLGFEFTFYALVALMLAGSIRRPVECLLLATSTVALAGLFVHHEQAWLAFLLNPILGEFALGVVAWLFWRRGLPQTLANLLVMAGALLLLSGLFIDIGQGFSVNLNEVVWGGSSVWRLIVWGIPSAMVVTGLACSPAPTDRFSRWLSAIGGASYSLYLVHLLVLAETFGLAPALHVQNPYFVVGITMTLCIAVGLGTYRFVERPIQLYLNSIFLPDLSRPTGAFDRETKTSYAGNYRARLRELYVSRSTPADAYTAPPECEPAHFADHVRR